MKQYHIPSFVISTVAEVIAECETHATLDSLFMYADAPGLPPEGSKSTKALAWVSRINEESGSEKLTILGRLIEKYMDEEVERKPTIFINQEQTNFQKDRIEKLKKTLARANIIYSTGGLLSTGQGLATKSLADLIKKRNIEAIDQEFERAIRNVQANPREAVSAACNILESIFKVYIEEHAHLELPAKQDLQSVWKIVKSDLGLDASKLEERDLQEIVSGIMATVNGIGALRTHASAAHGAAKKHYKLKPRHANLAIHAAHTIAAFVLETWNDKISQPSPN
jgi:hypothetical protein